MNGDGRAGAGGMNFDVAIVGAGPVGLSLARALAGTGLRLALIESRPEAELAEPPYDGREIAVTHHSARLLRDLGAWAHLPAAEISPLRRARVLNGESAYALQFDLAGRPEAELGRLVPNHRIRRALFRASAGQPDLALMAGAAVADSRVEGKGVAAVLEDGRTLRARLLVAADTRFSATRRRHGIGAEVTDFRRTMIVCRMEHERDHEHVATEWFGHGETVAMLPLNGRASSAVVTLDPAAAARLMRAEPAAFAAEVTRRYRRRLGAMRLAGTRHDYPLAATWAKHFAAPRLALVGDAAVGMLPITAHGFNLGLRGAHRLAAEMRAALNRGEDFAAPAVLRRHETAHRLAAWPLFQGTNALARLYSAESLPARLARHAALRLGNNLPPFKRAVRAMLMESEAPDATPSPGVPETSLGSR